MKKETRVIFSLLLTAALTIALVSCGGSKKAVKPLSGEEEITILCHGPEFNSDATAFRFSAIGKSMDLMTAKKKALSEARAGLAAAINTKIKGVIDNYVKSTEHQNREDLGKRYEGLTREVINQELAGTRTICEKFTKTKEGNFNAYVCLELGGSELLGSLNNRLSKDEMLKIDYDYEKFKKTFEEEMNKMGN
jgi:hypothetical protein